MRATFIVVIGLFGVVLPIAGLLLHKLGLRLVQRGERGPPWLLRQFVRDYVYLDGDDLVYRHHGIDDRMAIRDVVRIDYHYHAVVGFIGIYELVARDGRRLLIDERTPGFDHLWRAARQELPGLGPDDRSADIAAGDWEDSVTVWETSS
jgi:hypothetical protein